MKYIFKLSFLSFIIINIVQGPKVHSADVAIILALLASNIFREKYNNSKYLIIAETVTITIASYINKKYAFFYGVTVFDMIYCDMKWGLIVPFAFGSYFCKNDMSEYLFMLGISTVFSITYKKYEKNDKLFKEIYDSERRHIYELESLKEGIIKSSRETAKMAEIKERNRIAVEIHDTIGHKTAGILMQLQAAYKVHNKDEKKSMELIKKSIDDLSSSLEIIRDTVHNIKSDENFGIEHLKGIINSFKFCDIDFKYRGNLNLISADYMQIIISNIKEALTNAYKYSNATKINIEIEVNGCITRLYIKDNGIGCSNIKKGLGIKGMEERIKNTGGSISIDSKDGFVITCILPMGNGGNNIEGTCS